MKSLIIKILAVGFIFQTFVFNNVIKIPIKQAIYHPIMEPQSTIIQTGTTTSPIQIYESRDEFTATLIDSSMNGYGMISAVTRPLYVGEEGWEIAYRQWLGPGESSGAIGAAYSPDGETFSTINIDGAIGSYPSTLGAVEAPYVFWNLYNTIQYSYDQDGWGGEDYIDPIELWWVGDPGPISPDYSYDVVNNNHYFNLAYSDWTRGDAWLSHQEVYDIIGEEIKIIDATNYLYESYTSSPVLDINDDGIGYFSVTGFWDGADVEESEYGNSHTAIFSMTEDYGYTWSGGTNDAPYYFIPDSVFQHMFDNGIFPDSWIDPIYGMEFNFTYLFSTYDFQLRVDTEGNPHFILGLFPTDNSYVFPGIFEENGFYHFTIDKDYLSNPGEPQTETGWNYSFIMSAQESWETDFGGWSGWQFVFPGIAISEESDNVIWMVSSLVEDEQIDIFVTKSTDGGQSWTDPYNATNTNISLDCPDGLTNNSPDEICVHTGNGVTDEELHIVYQIPDYCNGSTTGDLSPVDYKNRVYAGTVTMTDDLSIIDQNEPVEFQLFQVYPNPFNAVVTISYNLSNQGNVKLMVFDILGKEVSEITNGFEITGDHQIIWDARQVNSGIYFIILETQKTSTTKKLMVLK